MRIEQVSADSFGPFSGAKLEFSSALTIVYGVNESGKSTWHAAIYGALCGIRRSRGRPRMSRVPLDFGGGPDEHQAASTS
jgi:uncharacterized protein YhaN